METGKREMGTKKKTTIHPQYTKKKTSIHHQYHHSHKQNIHTISLTTPKEKIKTSIHPTFRPNLTPKTLIGEPQNYMFAEMRSALAIDKSIDILDHIYALPTAAEQEAAHAKIQAVERRAMELQVPQPGLVTLMEYLDGKGVKKGICTRNFE